jgi:ubiquinone/menaquinone biosynthesis C-methylase UbiE
LDPKTLNRIYHDHEAQQYDRRFGVRFSRTTARRLRREVEGCLGRPLPSGRILDLGCGTGWVMVNLAMEGVRAVGVDLSPEMLRNCRRNLRAKGSQGLLVVGDGERLPFRTASFSLVIGQGVLHHVPAVKAALAETRRVTAPGGTALFLAEPTPWGEHLPSLLVRALLPAAGVLKRARIALGLEAPDARRERDFWELAGMAANLHTFAPGELARLAREAGFARAREVAGPSLSIPPLALRHWLSHEFPGLPLLRPLDALLFSLGRLDSALSRHLPPRLWATVRLIAHT